MSSSDSDETEGRNPLPGGGFFSNHPQRIGETAAPPPSPAPPNLGDPDGPAYVDLDDITFIGVGSMIPKVVYDGHLYTKRGGIRRSKEVNELTESFCCDDDQCNLHQKQVNYIILLKFKYVTFYFHTYPIA